MKTSASWLMVDVKANAGNVVTRASICRLGWKVWGLDNTRNLLKVLLTCTVRFSAVVLFQPGKYHSTNPVICLKSFIDSTVVVEYSGM